MEKSQFLKIVSVPPLDQLYSKSIDSEMNEIRWKVFAWIMSFSDDEISTIKQLSKQFLLISTILYVLVKVIDSTIIVLKFLR